MKHKITAIFAAVAAAAALFWAAPVAAGAAGTHSHAVSVDCVTDGGIDFTVFPADFTGGELSAGNYFLEQDVTLSAAMIVKDGTVNLCLNGHTLECTDSGEDTSVIRIEYGGQLNLCDCSSGGNGKVTGQTADGVCFRDRIPDRDPGVFRMYGGLITGIDYNDPSAMPGAAVRLSADDVEFHMYGGKISNNRALGVDIGTGRFYISGSADISGNGAAYAEMMALMSGQLEQAGIILGNIGSHIDIGLLIDPSTGSIKPVCIEGAITAQNQINVFMTGIPFYGTFTSGWNSQMSGEDPSDYFVSAADAFEVALAGGEAVLRIPPHAHKVCGDADCQDHPELEWAVWDKDDTLPQAAGNYYLTKDVTLQSGTQLSADIKLCLNGHAITQEGAGASALSVAAGVTLDLCDCQGTGTVKTTGGGRALSVSGTLNMYGGSITGSSGVAVNGAGVSISDNGTFNLYDGIISDNHIGDFIGADGGGVEVAKGSFYMYGGEISGNSANKGAGVNVVDGTFEMHGGKICGNEAEEEGGGVRGEARTSGIRVEDGEISGNSARYGGGIYVYADGTLAINGGSVTGNRAAQAGGGVYTGVQELGVSGSPVISGNTLSDGSTANNVYLQDPEQIKVAPGGTLSEGADIGVTWNPPEEITVENPIKVTGDNSGDYSAFFKSDKEGLIILNKDNAVWLALPHTHTLVHHEAVEPTCTEAGTGEYWECEGTGSCGQMFSDAAGTVEIAEIPAGDAAKGHTEDNGTVTKPATETEKGIRTYCCIVCGVELRTEEIDKLQPEHKHSFGTDWESDADSHWHECGCGEKADISAHDEDEGTITTPPTETDKGVKTYRCKDCGYVLRTEELPAMGEGDQPGTDAGKVDKDVETDGKAPETQLATPVKELADIVLTEAEKQQVEDGTDIRIVLDVKDASDSVGSGDKGLVEAALQEADAVKGYKVGQYLDISLFKIVGESRSAISRTNSKITVTIAIPDSLKNAGGEAATAFAVIRVHDGVAEILNDLDNDPETITIETDRFSTYVIVHSDSQGGDNEGDDNQGDDNEGDDNQGGDNEGDDNKGDDNEGDDNQGGDNEGDDNQGDDNEGDDNQGGDNEGDDNQGGDNEGDDNQGGDNEGDDNQGGDNEGDGSQGGDGNEGGGSQGDGNNGNKGDGNKGDGNNGNKGDGSQGDGNNGNKGDGSQGDGNNGNKGDNNQGDGNKNDGNSGADNSGVGGNGGTQGSSGADSSQPKDNEPKTGAGSRLGLYVALAMLAGLAYLSLHFAGHRRKK